MRNEIVRCDIYVFFGFFVRIYILVRCEAIYIVIHFAGLYAKIYIPGMKLHFYSYRVICLY